MIFFEIAIYSKNSMISKASLLWSPLILMKLANPKGIVSAHRTSPWFALSQLFEVLPEI